MICCTRSHCSEYRWWWILLSFAVVAVAGIIYTRLPITPIDTRAECPLNATFTTEHIEKTGKYPCKFPAQEDRTDGRQQYFDYFETKATEGQCYINGDAPDDTPDDQCDYATKNACQDDAQCGWTDAYFPPSSPSLKQRLFGPELPDKQTLDKMAQGIKHSIEWNKYKPGCKRIAAIAASKLADLGIPKDKINVEYVLGDTGKGDFFAHYVTTVDMGKDAPPMVLDFKPSIDPSCTSAQCENITWQQMHINGYYPPGSKCIRAVGEDPLHKSSLYHELKRQGDKDTFNDFWGEDKYASEHNGREWGRYVDSLSHSRLRLDYLMGLEGDGWKTKSPFPDTEEFKTVMAKAQSEGVTSIQDFFHQYEKPALEQYYNA